MSLDLARRATASLIGAEPDELSPDDVRDAAGELANMTGGGIKELFHDACQISLPTVVMGTDFQFSVPQGVIVYRKAFATEHGHFLVTVLEGEAQPAAHEAHHLHHEHDKGAQPGTVM
jgi:chemotaxis protein CheX